MIKHNANNERIKRQYFAFLKEAKRHDESTVDAAAMALSRFESHTKFRDFKAFHFEQAIAFKKLLSNQDNQVTGLKLSKSTIHAALAQLKRFFQWLALQPGYKSRLNYTDAEYFNLSDKDSRIANGRQPRAIPTIEQIRHVLKLMPSQTEIDRRNRAVIAFTLLTGARDGAIASMKLKHVEMDEGKVFQDAREVKTKFSKTFSTFFFPVGDDVRCILVDWVDYLRREKLWGHDDPLFPSTQMILGHTGQFEVAGIARRHWSNATPIRAIFRSAFAAGDLPYFNPHSFRHTLVRLAYEFCRVPEDFKAWSQNLGHEHVMTSLTSYGEVAAPRQGEIIHGLRNGKLETASHDADELANAIVRKMAEKGLVLPSG